MLRLSFAMGTEPDKWFRRYRTYTSHDLETWVSEDPLAELLAGRCDVALVRLPDPRVSQQHHSVSLYEETRGIAVPSESVYGELKEKLRPEDIAEENLSFRYEGGGAIDIPALREALQVVAANVGVAIAPQPLIKALSRKKVVALELVDPSVPLSSVGLVWPKSGDNGAIQDFVGVAKGRSMNSSRHSAGVDSAGSAAKKRVQRQKRQQGKRNKKAANYRRSARHRPPRKR